MVQAPHAAEPLGESVLNVAFSYTMAKKQDMSWVYIALAVVFALFLLYVFFSMSKESFSIELLLQHKDIDVNKISHSTGADWTPLGYATLHEQVERPDSCLIKES